MTKEEIQKLYKEHILPEVREPYHFEEKLDAPVIFQAHNPVCGDKFEVYLETDQGAIDEAYFQGFGCALSKASTSLLARELEGLPHDKAMALCEQFVKAVLEDGPLDGLSEPLKVLATLKDFDGRVDCIKLSWQALLDANNKRQS